MGRTGYGGRATGDGSRSRPPTPYGPSTRSPIPLDRALALGVIALAWVIAPLTALVQRGGPIDHHAIAVGPVGLTLGAVLLFLLAWQVMTGAMMLPSSLPLVLLFVRASAGQARPTAARSAFLAGYFAVWTWFAIVALAGDAVVHWLAGQTPWLRDRPWLIGGAVLLLAGGFQFSPLKERCLRECRLPFNFLQRHYRRGVYAAWDLGLQHGLFCLGCCWALMLTMFAVGVGNLAWMAALTGIMVIEKTMPWGRRLAPIVGALLIAWGLALLTQAEWLLAIGYQLSAISYQLSALG